jgi:hypothetical protein
LQLQRVLFTATTQLIRSLQWLKSLQPRSNTQLLVTFLSRHAGNSIK